MSFYLNVVQGLAMYFIGLMSGTSMDAIDAALVKFDDKASLVLYREYPIDNSIRYQIRSVNDKSGLGHITELDNELGHLFADAVNTLIREAGIGADKITAVGSHGQTVLHRPGGPHPASVQIGDPNIISSSTGITTVADFRRMDMANGGQGAPLASAFHEYQFQQKNKAVVILNIGGMANMTLLTDDGVLGFDTGPGNALLDDWILEQLGKAYDADAEWAKQGRIHEKLLSLMLTDAYFTLSPPKSTGRDYFNLKWLNTYLGKIDNPIPPEDIQATLLHLSAESISNAIDSVSAKPDEVIVCGGGAYNGLLMETLDRLLQDTPLVTTARYGLSPACIEAVTFAWLAKQRIENIPVNLEKITGAAGKSLLGGVYSNK